MESFDDKEDFKRRIGVGERQVTSRHYGTKRERPVINENNGMVAGKQIDHWDGRVDAVANAPHLIKANGKRTEERYD